MLLIHSFIISELTAKLQVEYTRCDDLVYFHLICFLHSHTESNKQQTASVRSPAFSDEPLLSYSDSSLASLSSCKYCVILPHALERPTTARRDTKRFQIHTREHTLIHSHTQHTHMQVHAPYANWEMR